jgi:hypothetical protein
MTCKGKNGPNISFVEVECIHLPDGSLARASESSGRRMVYRMLSAKSLELMAVELMVMTKE